ncbi:conserved protein of unknown function [Pseudorhizobium banfieldiae]|uniref:Uncharacterized protein n=1 Tax=Pseudorhizobium banfieldiae TaxID=1125847 RepID=L0NDF4_9HYPH|nr:PD-(D/E)XK nuclease-like domain-containing protein [Pseudorhizobium banfieldiae]CAD6605927.1 hypothetical protein RNT25_01749 [arsenite-oxidising bacterium NT-25]CCF19095.1 conserved protein of unknown function [Pseudorhizobium banfieldiae]
MKTYLDFKANEDGTYTLPPGIYFDLPEHIYHADTALGSTSIKDLASKPCKWQYDRLRPVKEVEPEHLKWGHAWHCRVLEGKAAFEERYAKPPSPKDYPDALNTVDDIKEFLRMHGQKVTGNKPDLMARAKEVDDCPPFFDEILARWHYEHPDYVELTERQVQEIEDAVANMQRDPVLTSVMVAGSLINGAAEMSIIWVDENGIRRKARFDYSLAPMGNRVKSLIVDLKSFTTFKGGSDEEAAIRKVYDMAYDLQVGTYMDGYFAARSLLEQGMVFGDPPPGDYLKNFFHSEGVDWVWVMMRRDNAMIPITLSIDTEDKMFDHAKRVVADALETYRTYMALFGPDQLWTPPPKMPLRLNHTVMPTYNRGIQYEQPNHR